MKPRHFWWLYEWKARGKPKTQKGKLTSAERNRLLNWMEQRIVPSAANN